MDESSETCTVILQGTLKEGGKETAEFSEYSKRSLANGEAHGGVVKTRYMVKENLGQGVKPDFIIVVEYPTYDKAKAAFSSDEYRAIIPLREVVFKDVKILLT